MQCSRKFSIEVISLEIKRDYNLNKLIAKKHNGLIKVITFGHFQRAMELAQQIKKENLV